MRVFYVKLKLGNKNNKITRKEFIYTTNLLIKQLEKL